MKTGKKFNIGNVVAGCVWGTILLLYMVVALPFLLVSLFADRRIWARKNK